MKLTFYKNLWTIKDLLDGEQHDWIRDEFGKEQEAVIAKTISMQKPEFDKFIFEGFLACAEVLKENADLMFKDESGVLHCLEFTEPQGNMGIIVFSDGYHYPRYTALLRK